MTVYDIFMHYYNDDIGQAVTNVTETDWYPCLTTVEQYEANHGNTVHDGSYVDIDYATSHYTDRLNKDKEAIEFVYMSKNEKPSAAENTEAYEKFITNSMRIDNPKYDMIFVWDGLGIMEGTKYGSGDSAITDQLYFDKMKRLKFKPWFFHSKYHSLKAAMTRAEQLIDLFGKEHIMIGKEVDLTQYIEIV
jgi:hypothetical protein